MGKKIIYEQFIWFDSEIRRKRYSNAIRIVSASEDSAKTAQRDIEFIRDRLNRPLLRIHALSACLLS